jgi:integrase
VQVLDTGKQVETFLNSIGRNSKNSERAYKSGLTHFANFLVHKNQTPDSIIPLLTKGNVNVYELLDQFVSYLTKQVGVRTLDLYMAAVRSFLEYSDVDIIPSKFRRRVKMPKSFDDPEEPLSLSDIRHLLQFCNNTRLTCYLLVLLSSGLRPMEAASLRLMDVDFSTSPTRINVRRETTKTKRSRIVYCNEEATIHLKKLLKFRKNDLQADTLIFSIKRHSRLPQSIYNKMLIQFEKLQAIADRDQMKENGKRHKITLHSFRRTCFSIINEQTNSEFANFYLGHSNSPYWTHKETERREIYAKRCMPYLTVLDYTLLDTQQKNIQAELQAKDKEIQQLRRSHALTTQRLEELEVRQRKYDALFSDSEQLIEMLREGRR